MFGLVLRVIGSKVEVSRFSPKTMHWPFGIFVKISNLLKRSVEVKGAEKWCLGRFSESLEAKWKLAVFGQKTLANPRDFGQNFKFAKTFCILNELIQRAQTNSV